MPVRFPLLIAFAMALAAPAAVLAQKYPAKPIRLVLPFTAASAVDVLARLYAQKMSEAWGQQVLVDNRTGAAGIIGMEAIAKSRARRLHARHGQRRDARNQSAPLRRSCRTT